MLLGGGSSSLQNVALFVVPAMFSIVGISATWEGGAGWGAAKDLLLGGTQANSSSRDSFVALAAAVMRCYPLSKWSRYPKLWFLVSTASKKVWFLEPQNLK